MLRRVQVPGVSGVKQDVENERELRDKHDGEERTDMHGVASRWRIREKELY